MSKREIGVSFQPFTQNITAGTISADRTHLLSDTTDVTDQSIDSVIRWIQAHFPEGMTWTDKDGKGVAITIEKIGPDEEVTA